MLLLLVQNYFVKLHKTMRLILLKLGKIALNLFFLDGR
jgi:hypothetical protein